MNTIADSRIRRAEPRAAIAALAAAAAVGTPVVPVSNASSGGSATVESHVSANPHHDVGRANPHPPGGRSHGIDNFGLCCAYGSPNHNEVAGLDDGR
jgi:hypothetical protein